MARQHESGSFLELFGLTSELWDALEVSYECVQFFVKIVGFSFILDLVKVSMFEFDKLFLRLRYLLLLSFVASLELFENMVYIRLNNLKLVLIKEFFHQALEFFSFVLSDSFIKAQQTALEIE